MDNASQSNLGCANGDTVCYQDTHLLQYQMDVKEQASLKLATQVNSIVAEHDKVGNTNARDIADERDLFSQRGKDGAALNSCADCPDRPACFNKGTCYALSQYGGATQNKCVTNGGTWCRVCSDYRLQATCMAGGCLWADDKTCNTYCGYISFEPLCLAAGCSYDTHNGCVQVTESPTPFPTIPPPSEEER